MPKLNLSRVELWISGEINLFKIEIRKDKREGVKLIFLIFFHRGIGNKKVSKVKNFQVSVPQDILSIRQKSREGGRSAPLPMDERVSLQ